jgi:hypothetical protein
MARKVAELRNGARVTDSISLGVLTKYIPAEKVEKVLQETGRESQRHRQLPAPMMVYYVLALALYMEVSYGEVLRCLLEGLEWLGFSTQGLRQTARSSISQARRRLGPEPLRRLYEDLAGPIAETEAQGAWYRRWRVVGLDGSSLDVADTEANETHFGRPASPRGGQSGFPQLRFVVLAETGTHVLFGAQAGPYRTSEYGLAQEVVSRLQPGMLCLADRGFYGYALWQKAIETGADLLWRVQKTLRLPVLKVLPDGSSLSQLYASEKKRRRNQGLWVRVIEYRIEGVDEVYRLITTLLDPEVAPAEELAKLYHERWEIESAFDELKTHLRGREVVLRSKTPSLVEQEFYGLLLTHYALRRLMHEAALHGRADPDEISFVHTIRVVRRKLPLVVASPPWAEVQGSPSDPGGNLGDAGQFQPRSP